MSRIRTTGGLLRLARRGIQLRRIIIMIVVVTIIIVGLGIRWALSTTYESDALRLSWRYEGQPLCVTGRVTDASGRPISGVAVEPVTASGGNRIYTDFNGEFGENVGERELREIVLGTGSTQETVKLNPRLGGISTTAGLRFEIVMKQPISGSKKESNKVSG